MKQPFILQMCLTIIFALAPLFISAHDCVVDGIYYNIDKAAKTATVTYSGNNNDSERYSGTIIIPEIFSLGKHVYTVTAIGSYAFNNCKDLTQVMIPFTVKTIGKHAFYSCTSLNKVWVDSVAVFSKINFEDEYSNPDCIIPENSEVKTIIEQTFQLRIFFGQGSSIIVRFDDKYIKQFVNYCNEHPAQNILISGYACDDVDSKTEEEYLKIQLRLSEMRCRAMKKELIEKYGIDEKRITTKAYGMNYLPSRLRCVMLRTVL